MSFAFSDLRYKDKLDGIGARIKCDFRGATFEQRASAIQLISLLLKSGCKGDLKFGGPDSLRDLSLCSGDREMRDWTIHTDASGPNGFGFHFELYGGVVVEGYGGWPEEVRADTAKIENSARIEAEVIKLVLIVVGPPPNSTIKIRCDNEAVVHTINGRREAGAESMETDQIRELFPTLTLRAEQVSRKLNRKADKLSKMTKEPIAGIFVYPLNVPANTVNTVRAIETGGTSNNGGTGDAASSSDSGGAGYSGNSGSTSGSSSSGDTGSTGDQGVPNSGSGSGSVASACEQAAGSDSVNEGASAASPTVTHTD